MLTVEDIMVKPVVTATPETPVSVARGLLQERARVPLLPVVEGGLLVGIVSERDLQRDPSEAVPLREVMTRKVFVLSPDTPVREAARVFRDRRLRAMPVLAGRELVGIVLVEDVLRGLDKRGEKEASP